MKKSIGTGRLFRGRCHAKPHATTRFCIVHEDEDGSELKRSEVFEILSDAPHYMTGMTQSCNLLEGDALRVSTVEQKRKPAAGSRSGAPQRREGRHAG